MLGRVSVVASLALVACAPRPVLCTTSCGDPTLACVAGECLREGRELEVGALGKFGELETRRLVVEPTALALVEPGEPTPERGPIGVLGRRDRSAATLLARFAVDLPPGTRVVEAHVLLDRAAAVDAEPPSSGPPMTLRAARIVGAWDERSVSWARLPHLEEVDAPRTPVLGNTAVVRLDVGALVRRWRLHARNDEGLAVLADHPTATGMAFALFPGAERPGSRQDVARPPRLELYVKP